jgi:hypothetical protein
MKTLPVVKQHSNAKKILIRKAGVESGETGNGDFCIAISR